MTWLKGSYARVVTKDGVFITLGIIREYDKSTGLYRLGFDEWDYGWYREDQLFHSRQELYHTKAGKIEMERLEANKKKKTS